MTIWFSGAAHATATRRRPIHDENVLYITQRDENRSDCLYLHATNRPVYFAISVTAEQRRKPTTVGGSLHGKKAKAESVSLHMLETEIYV